MTRWLQFFLRSGFALSAALLALTVSAADHYVRAGAAGTGDGSSWVNAYPALPSNFVRGDTYYVADGSYETNVSLSTPESASTYIYIKKATLSNHGSDFGWQSAYGDGVATFNGMLNFASSYWVFDGVVGGGTGSWTSGHGFKVIQTAPRPAIASGFNDGARPGSYLQFRHLEIVGNDGADQGGGSMGNDGVAIYGGSNITMSHSYIHDMGRCIFFLSTTDFVFENSYTGDLTSTAATHASIASIWAFTLPVRRVTFRHNIFTHAEGTGGIIMEGDDLRVYGNVFFHPSGDAWSHGNGLIGTWSASTLTNAKVYNNSFINVSEGWPVFGTVFTAPTTGNEARNNLFYSVASVGLGSLFPTYSHNHYIGTTSGGETGASTATGDPFVGYTALDFRLKSSTPTGTVLAAPYNVDMFGNTRGADGVWDRGAIEFTGNAPDTLPPAPPNNFRRGTP